MVDVEIPKHTVIQYVRDKKRVPYGVLVAVKVMEEGGPWCPHRFAIGYSLCNKKDRFSKRMALKIALGRANGDHIVPSGPHEVRKMFPAFFDRCKKYYKV